MCQARVSFKGGRLCEGVERGDFDFLAVFPEPLRGVCGKSLRRSKLIVGRVIFCRYFAIPSPNWFSPRKGVRGCSFISDDDEGRTMLKVLLRVRTTAESAGESLRG